jgi:outer membrane receptor protein involved in Fe transport
VDEWNNPHSDAFGDKLGVQKVVPYNTLNFGAYLIHEAYNSRNLFFDPAQGGNGPAETVNAGAKFRSGYFQQDDIAFYAQDDIHPIPQIHVTPGVRVVSFSPESYPRPTAPSMRRKPVTQGIPTATSSVPPQRAPLTVPRPMTRARFAARMRVRGRWNPPSMSA